MASCLKSHTHTHGHTGTPPGSSLHAWRSDNLECVGGQKKRFWSLGQINEEKSGMWTFYIYLPQKHDFNKVNYTLQRT